MPRRRGSGRSAGTARRSTRPKIESKIREARGRDVKRRSRLLPAALCSRHRLLRTPARHACRQVPGAPFPDYASAYEAATERCRGVRTMARCSRSRARRATTAARQARRRLRVPGKRPARSFRRQAGRSSPTSPSASEATLVLPREGRVLRDAPPAATLEALAGVAIGPEDLRTIVAGCGFAAGAVTRRARLRSRLGGGRRRQRDELAAADQRRLADGRRRAGSGRGAICRFQAGLPATIRLRAAPSGGPAKPRR